MHDQITAKAEQMAKQMAAQQAAFDAKQQELADRFRVAETAILPMFDGWSAAEVELFLGQVLLQRVKEGATYASGKTP